MKKYYTLPSFTSQLNTTKTQDIKANYTITTKNTLTNASRYSIALSTLEKASSIKKRQKNFKLRFDYAIKKTKEKMEQNKLNTMNNVIDYCYDRNELKLQAQMLNVARQQLKERHDMQDRLLAQKKRVLQAHIQNYIESTNNTKRINKELVEFINEQKNKAKQYDERIENLLNIINERLALPNAQNDQIKKGLNNLANELKEYNNKIIPPVKRKSPTTISANNTPIKKPLKKRKLEDYTKDEIQTLQNFGINVKNIK